MRRQVRWLLLPVLLFTVLAALVRPEATRNARTDTAALGTIPLLQLSKTDTVRVLFQCSGTRSVTPWQVTLSSPADSVVWLLDEASDVDSIEIRAKRNGIGLRPWPFRQGRPEGTKGRPAVQTDARDGKRTYPYEITAMCPGPGNSWRRAIIDPDIIIDF